METVAHPPQAPAGEDLQLLLDWKQPQDGLWRRAAAASLAIHAAAIVALALVPASAPRVPEPRIVRRVTPLIDPPTELTQTAPNKGKLSKEITADTILPRPRIQSPAPSSKRSFAPPPSPMANAPQPAPAEPPKIDVKEIPKLPPAQVAQVAPPQIMPQERPPEKPKLAFEVPGSPPAEVPKGQGTVAIPSSSIEEALRNVARNGARGGTTVGDETEDLGGIGRGLNLPPSAGRPRASLELKSDPMGVDFRPYLIQVLATVRRNWFSVYPESAKLGLRGKVVVQFSILRSGTIQKTVTSATSGNLPLDRAAIAALSASNPLPPLPANFPGERIILALTFSYNIAQR